MLSSSTSRSAARAARLSAARDYATECMQNAEQQDNIGLEDKILGNLSGILSEAIDCLRADQPFRSSSLSMLSLELLSYLRQPNKPMLVNFACAFTMLMSELEGIDLSERNPRSYSNSIPDVAPETAPGTVDRPQPPPPPPQPHHTVAPSSLSSAHLLPRPPPVVPILAAADAFLGIPKMELWIEEEEPKRPSVEPIEYEPNNPLKLDEQSAGGGEEAIDDAGSETNYLDDSGCSQHDLLQRMIADLSTPSTSNCARSGSVRNQRKNKHGRFESRDDELAATYNLPVSATEIENMPDKDMACLMRSPALSELQRSIMRQIRKRARSKISSREYRKRKEAKRAGKVMNRIEPAAK